VFHLDGASGVPVYLQIKEQVLHAIARGQLRAGDQLPTVREVAVDLEINPNTVNRAYADLEREGVLTSRRGRGTFVSDRKPVASDVSAQRTRIRDIARRALGEARAFGFDPDELVDTIARIAREDKLS
jgi:DNA-binding transcriptional regulator YhcF (GntR family)